MQPRDFCFWLQGFFEISRANGVELTVLTSSQVKMIEDHLKYVFAPGGSIIGSVPVTKEKTATAPSGTIPQELIDALKQQPAIPATQPSPFIKEDMFRYDPSKLPYSVTC